jgi:hypothetical protein
MAEWSKAVDLSAAWISTTEMCVGSNPTRVKSTCFCFFVVQSDVFGHPFAFGDGWGKVRKSGLTLKN